MKDAQAILPDWREADVYRRLYGMDRTGMMWEWLRRDPGYIAWQATASRATRGAADASPWGLYFRRGSVARRP